MICRRQGRHSQRETIRYICDFSRCRLNVRLCARIQPLLRGHKYGLFILLRVVLWLGRCRYRESDCRIAQKSIQKSSTNYRLQPRTSPSALPQKGHCRSQKRFENYKAMNYWKKFFFLKSENSDLFVHFPSLFVDNLFFLGYYVDNMRL